MRERAPLGHIGFFVVLLAYTLLQVASTTGWTPGSWSMPVIGTSWLKFLLVAVLAAWLHVRGEGLGDLGLKPPPKMGVLLRWVAVVMLVDTLATGLALAVLTRVFGDAAELGRFAELVGNLPLLLTTLPLVWLIAALGEEFFFRGFLLTGFGHLFGGTRWAWIAAVVLQAIAFGGIHAYQGPVGMISIGVGGLVYGAAFLLFKRNLWPLILAHGINDTVGFMMVYAGRLQT